MVAHMDAYQDRLTDQWEMERSLEYIVYCALTEENKRLSIYEYHPLPDDPTPAEIEIARQAAKKKKVTRWKQLIDFAKKNMFNGK